MLRCETYGAGPDIVFLHPVGLDGSCWHAVAAGLSERRITLVDLPGHGNSSPFPAEATLDDFAHSVIETLRSLGITRYDLVGLSFGGMIAQTVALRSNDAIRSLIVAGCPATFDEAARPAIAARGELALREGMAAVVESTLERWFTPAFLEAGGALTVREELLAENPAVWASSWKAISQLDTLPHLERVKVPTLCVAGEADQGSPPDAVRRIAAAIPGADYEQLPNAPHMMQIECPDLFAGVIDRFLETRAGA